MRLTLRTLLAYRDHVLSESDLSDLHKRIQQSEMAGNLLRRMEALSRRPQLLAPKVDGRGLGGDANSIAEYLDDILQSEKVPELERVCLESDVQLAELTQCHELLSTALNTPVEVPDELHDRIVGLLDSKKRAIEARKLGDQSFDSTGDDSSVSGVAHQTPDGQLKRVDETHGRSASDENQNQQSKRKKSDSSRKASPASAATDSQPVQSPMVASGGQSIRPSGLDLEGSQLAHEVPEYLRGRTRDGWRGPLAIGALIAILALLVWQSLGPWENVMEMFATRVPAPRTISPPVSETANDSSETLEGDQNSPIPQIAPATADPSDSKIKANSANAPEFNAVTPESNSNESKLPEPGPPVPPRVEQSNTPTANAKVPASISAIAWLPADLQEQKAVLLATSDGLATARRIAPAETIPSGSQIIVPPATRAIIDLAKQLRWTVCGPTKMVIKHDEQGATRPPTVELALGRALIASGPNGREVELITASWKGRISLGDASSMAAIELSYRPVAHGSVIDPRAFQSVLTLVAVEGQLTVTPQSADGTPGEKILLKVGEGIGLIGATPPQAFNLKEIPAWYRGVAERPIDVQAAEDLHRNLANSPRVHEVLSGLLMSRRPETAAIAAQTTAMLGHWEGIAGPASLLNSVPARSHWTTTLDLVRQVIAAQPQQATQLRSALMNSQPGRGNLLCDLILGLSEDRLKTDAIEILVGLLESEFLSERVIAAYQLKLISGKDLGYQASDVDRTIVQQWRRELANKRIRILPPGPILQEAK